MSKVKLVHISDTHNLHKKVKVPECDILIHSGDFSSRGNKYEVKYFLDWFSKLSQAKHKVLIAGNHDVSFDKKFYGELDSEKWLPEMKEIHFNLGNIHYLENSGVQLEGLNIWGSPVTPWFYGDFWSFNEHRGEDIKKVWSEIPNNTDILITHGPTHGLLDMLEGGELCGCVDLRNKVKEIKPLLHLCGHIHSGYGITTDGYTVYSNASICNEAYMAVNQPNDFEIEVKNRIVK